ncbi:MAG TPA: SdrD B-like domain-containing protein [Acidimicrobiales bacterium]
MAVRRLAVVSVLFLALTGVSLVVRPAPALAVNGTVAGTVFEDYNANGQMDAGSTAPASASATDVGVKGASVTVTDSADQVVGSGTTGPGGTFTIPVTAAATNDVRVQVTPPAGYTSGPQGPDSATTVQFVDLTSAAAGAVGVGLVRQGNYSPDGPRLLSVLQVAAVNGSSLMFVNQAAEPTLVSSGYADRGTAGTTPEAHAADTGAIWGLGQLDARYAFTGAYFKRHAFTGPGGLGAIYLTDLAGGPNVTLWTTIPNPGVNPRPNEGGMTADDWFHDAAAYPEVGKIGLGGMAMAPDHASLYVVNLNTKSLFEVPVLRGAGGVPVAGSEVDYALPVSLPGATAGCSSQANVRPFGVSVQNGSVWVTLTCTGPAVADLRGYVYRFDVVTKAFDGSPAFEMALGGYPRGSTFVVPAAWNPWDDVTWPAFGGNASKPQPLLSDVVFDSNGDMTIGIKDRFGDEAGSRAGSPNPLDNTKYDGFPAGDVLRACRNAADTAWVLESNGVCGTRTGARVASGKGPGGGEFYADNFVVCCHDQVSLGALLQLPGYGEVINTAFDPGLAIVTEGYRFYSNTDGRVNGFHQIRGNPGSTGGGFGKSGGLGDMAALVAAAPLEIGNRVWSDSDGDGIQDAGEPPLAGVTVNLYAADGVTLLATAVTDATGTYYFTNAAGTSTPSAIFGVTGLQPGTGYVVRLDNPADAAAGGPLAALRPTATGVGTDPQIDSNGVPAAGSEAVLTTGGEGVNDHSIDFGFVTPASLGDFVWDDLDGDGVQDPGEPGIPGVPVRLFQGATEVGSTVTDASGRYLFPSLAPGTYHVGFDAPPGRTPSPRDTGPSDGLDSDADPAGLTVDTVLLPGENDLTWDAGFVRTSPTTEPPTTTTTSPPPPPTVPTETKGPRFFGENLSKTGADIGDQLRMAGTVVAIGAVLLVAARHRRGGLPRRARRRAEFEEWARSAPFEEVMSFMGRL